MYKQRFGQAHCIDLLKRIHTKFTLYFSDISINFQILETIWIFKTNRNLIKNAHNTRPNPAEGNALHGLVACSCGRPARPCGPLAREPPGVAAAA
jgi:hypothetical protein